MSWVVVAVSGGMAAKGAYDGYRQNKIGEADNQTRAEVIRYSPWTGLADPGAANYGQGILGTALDKGLQGALIANSFGGGKAGVPNGAAAANAGTANAVGLTMPANGEQYSQLVMPSAWQQVQTYGV